MIQNAIFNPPFDQVFGFKDNNIYNVPVFDEIVVFQSKLNTDKSILSQFTPDQYGDSEERIIIDSGSEDAQIILISDFDKDLLKSYEDFKNKLTELLS